MTWTDSLNRHGEAFHSYGECDTHYAQVWSGLVRVYRGRKEERWPAPPPYFCIMNHQCPATQLEINKAMAEAAVNSDLLNPATHPAS